MPERISENDRIYEVDKFMKTFDSDNDGMIQRSEWLSFFRNWFEKHLKSKSRFDLKNKLKAKTHAQSTKNLNSPVKSETEEKGADEGKPIKMIL